MQPTQGGCENEWFRNLRRRAVEVVKTHRFATIRRYGAEVVTSNRFAIFRRLVAEVAKTGRFTTPADELRRL